MSGMKHRDFAALIEAGEAPD
jgi:hypothetical protein